MCYGEMAMENFCCCNERAKASVVAIVQWMYAWCCCQGSTRGALLEEPGEKAHGAVKHSTQLTIARWSQGDHQPAFKLHVGTSPEGCCHKDD